MAPHGSLRIHAITGISPPYARRGLVWWNAGLPTSHASGFVAAHFRSLADLIRAIEEYLAHHNRHAEPFTWTATATTILRKVRHRKQA